MLHEEDNILIISGTLIANQNTNTFQYVEVVFLGMHIGYWREIQKERDHWEDQDVGGWTILKWILQR
jgi:hypothetical protein